MKNVVCALIIAAAALFMSATVWEGTASVVSDGDLPGGGPSIATNAYPKNSIVYVTNLENNRAVAVVVTAGLETSGLLAVLSKNAADSIGLKNDSIIRIRMTQPSDAVAFSRYRTDQSGSSFSENDGMESYNAAEFAPATPDTESGTSEIYSEDLSTGMILDTDFEPISSAPISDITYGEFADPIASEGTISIDDNGYVFIDPVSSSKTENSAFSGGFSPFQAPLIGSIEAGKWYIQLGAYTKAEQVEDEISRISSIYPVAVQNAGTDIQPLFRLLLGPMNRGESAAMLQQIKSIGYRDAFERNR